MDSFMCEASNCKCNVCQKYNMVCCHAFGSDLRIKEAPALFGLSTNHVGNFYDTTIQLLEIVVKVETHQTRGYYETHMYVKK